MTNAPSSPDSHDHKQHADAHLTSAKNILIAQEDGWTVTAAFYSAFHVMRAATLADPIWEKGPSALTRVNPHLTLDCRNSSHHQGNPKAGRAPGVRELVRWLYRKHSPKYVLLHAASITVRYGTGTSTLLSPANDYIDKAQELLDALKAGQLKTR